MLCLNVAGVESAVPVDDRLAKMESDLGHVQTSVGKLELDVRDIRTDFHGFKVEVVREIGDFKTEMAKELGSIRKSLEQNKVWMLMIAFGSVIVPAVTTLAHALKWF
jgi:hypothetical protein